MKDRDEMAEGGSSDSDAYRLSHSEARRRSLAGVLYMTSSSVASLVVGFLANLVLARLLLPSQFGVVAIGSTAMLIAGALADGGLGAGMVRRPKPPTLSELKTLNGIQLVLGLTVCVPAIAIALNFGLTGQVTAVMIVALPIMMLQTPGRITLTREMKYDRQVAIDFGSQLASQVFSVTLVVLGAGVWGLALGAIVKAVVGTLLTARLSIGFNAPSLRGWRDYGPLVRFGLTFQANWYAFVAREQCINVVIGLVAGLGTLGIWSFTNRLFQLPALAFSSLYVVGFPAMTNYLAQGGEPGPLILRTVRRASIVATLVFPAFAAASPKLIPSIFGNQWRDAAIIMPFICLSTLVLGSISVAATSYLSAAGRPGIVAKASIVFGVIWPLVTGPLLPVIGVAAIGLGNLIGALVEAAILDRATYRMAGVKPNVPLRKPLAVALVSGAVGVTLCVTGSGGLLLAVLAAALTVTIAAGGLWILCREDFLDSLQLASGAVRSIRPGARASVEGV